MRRIAPLRVNESVSSYVIVGCGMTAAVNYSTRLTVSDEAFTKDHTFVGRPELWGEYASIKVGQ